MAHLTHTRVRTIMKTADGADTISKEAVLLATRATELFIRSLVKEGYNETMNGKKLNYSNLVNVIHNSSRYEFLEIVIPKKITVREYKELMAKHEKPEEIHTIDSSSEDDSADISGSVSEDDT